MNQIPLWLRPSELGRRLAGHLLEYTMTAAAATSATAVVIDNGETLSGKLQDALVVPDLLATARQTKYLLEHKEEIESAMNYLQNNAPSPDEFRQLSERAKHAASNLETLVSHIDAIGANLSLSDMHPFIAYEHADAAAKMLPDVSSWMDAIRVASDKTSDAVAYLRGVDIDPYYRAMINTADNFASDERALTVGVACAVGVTFYAAGQYLGGLWANRGAPSLFSKLKLHYGVRKHADWYEKHLPHVLGPLYGVAERHFKKKFQNEQ